MTARYALCLFAALSTPACTPEDDSDLEHFYTEEWDQAFFEGKDDGARVGRFETFTGKDGRAYFHLLAGNGQKVLHSQGYASPSGAADGIDSVRATGTDLSRYRLLEAADGSWYFNLVAANGRVIGTSELYVTRSNAERGASTVAALVLGATEKPAARRAAFQAFRGLDGQYYFHLRAGNGQIVLRSEGYTRRASAIAGTDAVLSYGADPEAYEVRDAAGDQAYFVLAASNGEVLAVSETYASRSNALRGAADVAALLATADVDPAE